MQLALQRRWWSFLSVALHNSIAASRDPTLDIAEGTFPVASAIDVWVITGSAGRQLLTGSRRMIELATAPLLQLKKIRSFLR